MPCFFFLRIGSWCQSIALKRGKSLYFRLGRSHHSRNSHAHRLITRVRIQSAHSEWKKRSSWILFLIYQLIPIHSVKVSTAFSRPSTKRCTMLIGIGTSCTRPRGQHSWQSSLVSPEEGIVWLCSWCCLIDVECRFSPSENLHFLSGRELKSLCQVGCSMSLYPLHLHLFESPDPDLH